MRSRLVFLFACMALLLMSVPTPALAQVHTQFGIEGGINLANVDFTPSNGNDFNPDFKSRTLGVGGVFVAWDFHPNAGLQIDALYSQKGTKAAASFTEDGETFDFTIEASVDYIDIPILFRANIPASDAVRFRVLAGPAIAFKVTDDFKQTVDGIDVPPDEGDAPDFKSTDFSLVVGGAAQFGHFFVDGRYSWGLVNIVKDDEDKVKTRTASFMVGIVF